jgi:hypothetical protein
MSINNNMDDIIILKTLGSGLFGTTYLVKHKNKLYALKRQKILKSYILKGTKYPMWREFKFYKWIDKLNENDQKFFMKLYDYKFYANCNYDNKSYANDYIIEKLNKSKHCLDLLLDLKDGVLANIIKQLSIKQYVSMVIQYVYAIYLMAKNKYDHTDLHLYNYTFKNIPTHKIIKVSGYKIPSYGYQFSIIDYGLIKHVSFEMGRKERIKYNNHIKYNHDMNMFFIYVLTGIRFAVLRKGIRCWKQLVDKLYNNKPLYERIKTLIVSIYPSLFDKFNDYESSGKLSKIMYFEIIQYLAIYDKRMMTDIFGVKYKKNVLSNEDLEYIKLNIVNPKYYENIIKYLIMNIERK